MNYTQDTHTMTTTHDNQLDLFAGNAGLSQTQQVALQRLIKTLDVLPVKYVIKAADGATYTRGDLQVTEPKVKMGSKTKRSPYPRGALTAYVKPYLANMRAGDVARVPVAEYDYIFVSHACSAHAHRAWGAGTYITKRTTDGLFIEVLRVTE